MHIEVSTPDSFICFFFKSVFPAYTTMLGHLHAKAFENFKTKLEQSLKNGEGFAASVRSGFQSSMLEFDQGSAGNARRDFSS
ncbi:hypothetical protein K1719_006297 [Acacia pycnantha]|nr:hypothetical protein K1719_006297 [Acacia pycnantha]